MRGFERFKTNPRELMSKRYLISAALVIAGVVVAGFFFTKVVVSKNNTIAPAGQPEKVVVDKNFTLEAYPSSLKENGKPVTVVLKNVQKTNSITINGKKTTLKPGSTFVLLTFVIDNPTNDRLLFPTRDFVRYVDPNGKKFAPSVSEQSIVLEPQATKIDTIGFVEPDNLTSIKFSIGTLNQEKEVIETKFTK